MVAALGLADAALGPALAGALGDELGASVALGLATGLGLAGAVGATVAGGSPGAVPPGVPVPPGWVAPPAGLGGAMRFPAACAWAPRSWASAGRVSFQPPSMWSGPCTPVVAVMRSGFNRAISGYRSGSPRKRWAMYHNQSPCLTSYVGAGAGVAAVMYAAGVIAGAGMRTVQPG